MTSNSFENASDKQKTKMLEVLARRLMHYKDDEEGDDSDCFTDASDNE